MKITAKLSSIHYRRSPLFQGGLDIPCEVTVTISVSIKRNLLMQHYEKMVYEFYCQPKNETIMGSLTENINVNFDIQQKKKRKKTLEKLFKNPKGPRTFNLSSKNDNVKKILLCNLYFIIKKKNQRFFLKNFTGIYFRESALFNFVVSIDFHELAFFGIFARAYFCEFEQNLQKLRKLIRLRK